MGAHTGRTSHWVNFLMWQKSVMEECILYFFEFDRTQSTNFERLEPVHTVRGYVEIKGILISLSLPFVQIGARAMHGLWFGAHLGYSCIDSWAV